MEKHTKNGTHKNKLKKKKKKHKKNGKKKNKIKKKTQQITM